MTNWSAFRVFLRLAPRQKAAAPPVLDRVNHEALLGKAVPDLLFGDATFHLLEHVAALICHFNQKFSHEMMNTGEAPTPLHKSSIQRDC